MFLIGPTQPIEYGPKMFERVIVLVLPGLTGLNHFEMQCRGHAVLSVIVTVYDESKPIATVEKMGGDLSPHLLALVGLSVVLVHSTERYVPTAVAYGHHAVLGIPFVGLWLTVDRKGLTGGVEDYRPSRESFVW